MLLLSACSSKPTPKPAIGEAYVGPATLNLRREIPLKSAVVATVKHGERLEILRVRRSFLLVRTASGAEGWTDARQLLTTEEVGELRKLEEEARNMPSQGVASTYDLLNVHTAPDRLAPSFLQIKEGEKVDVIGHCVAPRVSSRSARRKLVEDPAPAPRKTPRKTKPEKFPPPPMPAPPKLPDNWLELSKRPAGLEPESESAPPPPPSDDWSLVRTASGRSGWVLTRRIYMAIPDEVAQYAEGKRITSYFSLGTVEDGGQIKHHWLWTTIEQPLQPYQFDGMRVFVWSLRRHRYETAYRERNLKGFYPVTVHTVDMPAPGKKGAAPKTVQTPGFSLLVEGKDGLRYRRDYAFLGNIVKYLGQTPVPIPAKVSDRAAGSVQAGEPKQTGGQSFIDRVKHTAAQWRKRIFGK